MMNAKRIFLIVISLVGLFGIKSIIQGVTQYDIGDEPGFEIINKDQRPIWVAIVANGRLLGTGKTKIGSQQVLAKVIDPEKEVVIGVYYTEPKEVELGTIAKIMDKVEIKPQPDFVFGFEPSAKGKTKYLTWNPAKHNKKGDKPEMNFYPQTGVLFGLLGKSSSGYSLKYNVKQNEIRLKTMK